MAKELEPQILDLYAGVYEFSDMGGFTLNVTRTVNKLYVTGPDQAQQELLPLSTTRFFMPIGYDFYQFDFVSEAASNQPDHLVLTMYGMSITGVGSARVEPGVTNQALQDAVAAHGFFWPPDPTSAAVCTIGGNLACNAAGPRAIKYGTTRDNTLGLRAVTGAGEEIRTGVMNTKGVVGYDFTRLLIGSEGTLAVITEATLKLTPLPEARHTLQATYRSVSAAAAAVSAIMAGPVTPCALELMDRGAIDMIRGYQDLGLGDAVSALLMIEVDGPRHGLDEAADSVVKPGGDSNAITGSKPDKKSGTNKS